MAPSQVTSAARMQNDLISFLKKTILDRKKEIIETKTPLPWFRQEIFVSGLSGGYGGVWDLRHDY